MGRIREAALTRSAWIPSRGRILPPALASLVLAGTSIALLVFVVRYQRALLYFREWVDESETVVTSKMIANGERLYEEIFNHHGALTFVAGAAIERFGEGGIPAERVAILLLQLASFAALLLTPLAVHWTWRITITVGVACVTVLWLPDLLSNTYTYQSMAGPLALIALALFVLPTMLDPDRLRRWHVAVGAVALVCVFFLAFTYAAFVVGAFVAAARRQHLRTLLISIGAAVLANVLVIVSIASVRGYIAFHIYMNIGPLSQYGPDGQPSDGVRGLLVQAFATIGSDAGFTMLSVLGAAALVVSARRTSGIPWRTLALTAGIASFLIRGANYHALPFVDAMLALPLVLVVGLAAASSWQRVLTAAALVLVFARPVSLTDPVDAGYIGGTRIPESTEFSGLVDALTEPDDEILVYTFSPIEYLAADRLPASPYFFYFPWQADYDDAPILGLEFDVCGDMRADPPKVVMVDKQPTFAVYSWQEYGGCIDSVLRDEYVRVLPDRPFYVRADLEEEADEWLETR